MNDDLAPDWDPRALGVLRDQSAAYDEMRERCPVAYSDYLQWSVFRHADVSRALNDHQTFSNAASQHLSVPNGMDPPEHTAYRRLIEPYFSPQRMAVFEPSCREIVTDLVRNTIAVGDVEVIADLALPFAIRVQCAFLGWPPSLHEAILRWTQKKHEATLTQDRQAMSEVALEFERFIDDLLDSRMRTGAAPEDDETAALMHEKLADRPLNREEIVSILRNWTVGEVGTISAAVGILVHYLAQHADLQQQLRAKSSLVPAAIDEILRLQGPLPANRRVTTRPVEIGGQKLAAGARLSLIWIAANRDGRVFDDPEEFRLDRDPGKNLLYGAGVHVCPGAPLARMELRLIIEELLERTTNIQLVGDKAPTNAVYPASGFATLPLRIE